MDDFVGIVLFENAPVLDVGLLEADMRALEPGVPVSVRPAARPGTVLIAAGGIEGTLSSYPGEMSSEMAVSSIGMADMDEKIRERLMMHGGHAIFECTATSPGKPMEKLIAILKMGMAMCRDGGGWALCLPASGLCVLASDLQTLAETNGQGPRAWAVDDSEAALGNYDVYTLWDSLRTEAQPANLLVGFVPAEVEGKTWFFSGGHSLFNLPELLFADGAIDDFEVVREYFRFLFPYFYKNPMTAAAGRSISVDDSLSFQLEALPEQYAELQSSTGTLRVTLVEKSSRDTDWD